MNIREKTLEEIENRINRIEDVIHDQGVGSSYLKKAENIQRDLNLGLILGGATAFIGLSAWLMLKDD